jgi:hypothetical protein
VLTSLALCGRGRIGEELFHTFFIGVVMAGDWYSKGGLFGIIKELDKKMSKRVLSFFFLR